MPDKITRMWIWDVLEVVCMILWNYAPNWLNLVLHEIWRHFTLNVLSFIAIGAIFRFSILMGQGHCDLSWPRAKSTAHTPSKQAKYLTRLILCEFFTFWGSFAWFCEIRHQIDSIFVFYEFGVILRWICYFTLPLGHNFCFRSWWALGLKALHIHHQKRQNAR
jgi:hypothetical protein